MKMSLIDSVLLSVFGTVPLIVDRSLNEPSCNTTYACEYISADNLNALLVCVR